MRIAKGGSAKPYGARFEKRGFAPPVIPTA